MACPRVYHDGPLPDAGEIQLTGGAARHLVRVLRLEAGAELSLFNGDGRELAGVITTRRQDRVTVRLTGASSPARESPLQVILLQGICRGPRMDLVIQKATELGVTAIRPIGCQRSVVRLAGERADRRLAHWRGVMAGAAEQSGRVRLPALEAPADLAAALAELPADSLRLTLDPAGTLGLGAAAGSSGPVALLVGPEGGLTAGEQQLARDAGFQAVRLGPRILRTETAPLAALSVLQFLRGDLNG